MPKLLLLVLVSIALTSCGNSKKASQTNSGNYSKERNTSTANQAKANTIISYAKQFTGVPYKYGGTSRSGMDCSGLVFVAFNQENITLPRVSRDMATQGVSISLNSVAKGDLLFFKTNKNSNQINHVGLIVATDSGVIRFIHSTTSRGVIISSLDEPYWNNAFVGARRLI